MKPQKSRFAKELADIDPPWVRIEDFAKLKFKRPAVLVNGTFDIIHSGHFKIIAHARRHCKTLIVAIDSDALVGRKKPGRPFLTWVERAVQFRFLPVDYIVEVDSDGDFKRLVQLLKPDLRVRGAEYRNKPSRIPEIPSLWVHDSGIHTSDLVARIAQSQSNPGGSGGPAYSNGVDNRPLDVVCGASKRKGTPKVGQGYKPRKQQKRNSQGA